MNFIGVKTITKFILKHFAMQNYFTQGVFYNFDARNYKQFSKAETLTFIKLYTSFELTDIYTTKIKHASLSNILVSWFFYITLFNTIPHHYVYYTLAPFSLDFWSLSSLFTLSYKITDKKKYILLDFLKGNCKK